MSQRRAVGAMAGCALVHRDLLGLGKLSVTAVELCQTVARPFLAFENS